MVIEEIGPTMLILIYIAFVMGLANVCLLLGLLNSYWKTYKEIKSQFTIGLLYFGSFLSCPKYFSYTSIGGSISNSHGTV